MVKENWNSRKRMEFSALLINSVKVQRQKWKYCHMREAVSAAVCLGGKNFILGSSG